MKRAVVFFLVLAFVPAATLAAQWTGMPVWNDPTGGTGIVLAADWGMPNADAGNGDAYGGRVSLGLGTVTLTGGVASYKPDGYNDATTTYGGQLAFRLIGGSLSPVAVNLQVGAGTSGAITSGTTPYPHVTTVIGAMGISVPLPTPGVSIEGFFSPGARYHEFTDRGSGLPNTSTTKFGYSVGGNLGFGTLGIHLVYDYEKTDAGSNGIFGLGLHFALRPSGL